MRLSHHDDDVRPLTCSRLLRLAVPHLG